MDANEKIKKLTEEVQEIARAEAETKNRINALKHLLMEKKKRLESLKTIQEEEIKLLKELELA